MTSSTVWDLTEASVAILGRLPLILQTWGLIALAQAIVSKADTLVYIVGSLKGSLGGGLLAGIF